MDEPAMEEPLLPKKRSLKLNSCHKLTGIFIIICSTVLLQLQKLFARIAIDNSSVTPFQLIYTRSLAVLLIVTWVPLCNKSLSLFNTPKDVQIVLMIRGFSSVWSGLMLYLALEYIPYSEAILLTELKPVFAAFFSALIVGEKILKPELLSLVISIVAVFIYADPGGVLNGGITRAQDFKEGVEPGNIWGIIFGFLKAISGALGGVLLRKAAKNKINAIVPTFYMGLLGVIQMPVIIIPEQIIDKSEYHMTWYGGLFIALSGVSFVTGQLLLAKGYNYESTNTVMVVGYLELILAIFFDLIIFDSKLRWTDYLASLLITIALLVIFVYKWKKK